MVGGSWSGGSIRAPSTETLSKTWRSRHLATLEVRKEQELAEPAHLVKRLVKQQTTLANELPDAVYEQASWLGDRAYMKRQANPTHPRSLIHAVQS